MALLLVERLKPLFSAGGGQALKSVFFFQAEDGIRYDLVTGVQTCALPIYNGRCLLALQGRNPPAASPLPTFDESPRQFQSLPGKEDHVNGTARQNLVEPFRASVHTRRFTPSEEEPRLILEQTVYTRGSLFDVYQHNTQASGGKGGI